MSTDRTRKAAVDGASAQCYTNASNAKGSLTPTNHAAGPANAATCLSPTSGSLDFQNEPAPSQADAHHSRKTTLIVNLSHRATQHDVEAAFSRFGRVVARVACRPETRHPTEKWRATAGYAFVRFPEHSAAGEALEVVRQRHIFIHDEVVTASWARTELQVPARVHNVAQKGTSENLMTNNQGTNQGGGNSRYPDGHHRGRSGTVDSLPHSFLHHHGSVGHETSASDYHKRLTMMGCLPLESDRDLLDQTPPHHLQHHHHPVHGHRGSDSSGEMIPPGFEHLEMQQVQCNELLRELTNLCVALLIAEEAHTKRSGPNDELDASQASQDEPQEQEAPSGSTSDTATSDTAASSLNAPDHPNSDTLDESGEAPLYPSSSPLQSACNELSLGSDRRLSASAAESF